MSDAAYAELRADIAANGLLLPITLFEEQVLDGWSRYNGCLETGTEPRFAQFDGDYDAARRFVISSNLLRRHLTTTGRAMTAARMADLPHGTNQHSGDVKLRLLVQDAA